MFESFPSGDVAGAMVFSMSLFMSTNLGILSFAFVSMSAFGTLCIFFMYHPLSYPRHIHTYIYTTGRMYFWAHHLFDVSVGALIAAICCSILNAAIGWENFNVFYLTAIGSLSRYAIKYFYSRPRNLPKKFQTKSAVEVKKVKQLW